MKTQSKEALTRASGIGRSPLRDLDIDTIAKEIFAQLNDKAFDVSAEDPQRYLKRTARLLLEKFNPTPNAVRATLNAFPRSQREMLLLHLGGLTCSQIAQRQGKSIRAVMKILARAYARARIELNPM